MAAKKKETAQEIRKDEVFTLDQLLAAEKFSHRKDLLRAVLSGSETYSISEAEKKIEEFMKGKVK